MKITFISNFLNHHQLPLCKELIKNGADFTFIATEPVPQDRLQLGYEDMNNNFSFVLKEYEGNREKTADLLLSSDAVIIGGIFDKPEFEYIKNRLNQNKLTFRYNERFFKRGYLYAFDPRVIKTMLFSHTKYKRNNLFMLCASAYVPCDYSIYKAYTGKFLKWGYFPEVKEYTDEKILFGNKSAEKTIILWVGRFLKLKHPEDAIKLCLRLKQNNYNFVLKMIGAGPEEDDIKHMITACGLEEQVKMTGPMPHEKVREEMEKANIFLFTSDYNEGWGAVINEAMNSGCAVVASHAAGAAPFLIKHNENGLIYQSGNIKDLYKKTADLINDAAKAEALGKKAYETMLNLWSPKNAAESLYDFCKSALEGAPEFKNEGPCSKAVNIRQGKMFKAVTYGKR